MLDKVRSTIEEYSMISSGEIVLVGVSGGPDSISLLHSLQKLSSEIGFGLHVVHVHHGLRPEADEEAQFVTSFAKSIGIATTVKYLNPEELRHSMQELAREKRRDIFLEECSRLGATKVALGHNANDQAETVLQRLLRGGGSGGLGGIHPKRGMFIRPLLFVPRQEIENYIQQESLDFRVDKSNFKPIYLRNKIRLSLIPILEEYNPRVVDALGKTAKLLQEDNFYLDQEAEIKCNELTVKVGRNFFLPNEFTSLPKPIATRVIRRIYAILVDDPRGLEYEHVTKVLSLGIDGRSGAILELPACIKVLKEMDGLLFYSGALVWPEIKERTIEIPGESILEDIGARISCRIVDNTTLDPKDPWSIALDYDSLVGPIWIRNRKPGDKILVKSTYKKLKEIYNILRVPSRVRETRPLVVVNGQIVWIPGIIKSGAIQGSSARGRVLELVVYNN
jgi:tRNA(Ile)-lysidine synthase